MAKNIKKESERMKEKNSEKKVFWKNPRMIKWGIIGAIYGLIGPHVGVFGGFLAGENISTNIFNLKNMMQILGGIIFTVFGPPVISWSILYNLVSCTEIIDEHGFPLTQCEGNFYLVLIPNVIIWSSIGILAYHLVDYYKNRKTKR